MKDVSDGRDGRKDSGKTDEYTGVFFFSNPRWWIRKRRCVTEPGKTTGWATHLTLFYDRVCVLNLRLKPESSYQVQHSTALFEHYLRRGGLPWLRINDMIVCWSCDCVTPSSCQPPFNPRSCILVDCVQHSHQSSQPPLLLGQPFQAFARREPFPLERSIDEALI